jgi:hypothetical protein
MKLKEHQMLDVPEPAPTGLITALLGLVRPGASEITEAIGPSPRQMRELIEGRSLFSPYKIGRVAALTRIPEGVIRDAITRIPEMLDLMDLRDGASAEHPRLGRCEVIAAGPEVSVRTESGTLVDGIHPLSFAGPDLLDRFGLTPTPLEGETARTVSDSKRASEVKASVKIEELATQPATQTASMKGEEHVATTITPNPGTQKETSRMSTEQDPEPAIPMDAQTASLVAEPSILEPERTAPREALRDLIAGSGMSQAALSRALGRDASFLNAILTRGRRMPEELPDQIRALIRSEVASTADTTPAVLPASCPAETIPSEVPQKATEETRVTDATHEPLQTLDHPETVGEASPDTGARLIVLEQSPSGPESSEAMDVIIDGVCRIRVPRGFDMEAAARLIRCVSAPFRSATLTG